MLAQQVSFWAAVIGGLLSFLSPCVLPLIPVYLGYMTGGIADHGGAHHRMLALRHAAMFVLGFGVAFVSLGAAAGIVGRLLYPLLPYITRVAGAILILFGLQMLGLLHLSFLAADRHVDLGRRQQGLWRSLLMGLAFAVGWSPCVGPVLSAILIMAADTQTALRGALLLGGYAIGLGLPFLLAGLLAGELRRLLSRAGRVLAITTRLGGALVLLMGFMMLIGQFERLVFGLISG